MRKKRNTPGELVIPSFRNGHDWSEPLSPSSFCVDCGCSPYEHSDLEPCPQAGRGLFLGKALERWINLCDGPVKCDYVAMLEEFHRYRKHTQLDN